MPRSYETINVRRFDCADTLVTQEPGTVGGGIRENPLLRYEIANCSFCGEDFGKAWS